MPAKVPVDSSNLHIAQCNEDCIADLNGKELHVFGQCGVAELIEGSFRGIQAMVRE